MASKKKGVKGNPKKLVLSVSKKSLEKALTTPRTEKERKRIIANSSSLSRLDICMIFSFCDYDLKGLREVLLEWTARDRGKIKARVITALKDVGMTIDSDFSDLKRKRDGRSVVGTKKTDIEKGKKAIEEMVDTISSELNSSSDIRSENPADFRERIATIAKVEDDQFTVENIIKAYRKVFIELMKLATGQGKEVEQTIAYIVQTDSDGNIISRTIKPNAKDELVVVEKTKFLPASGRAFGEAVLVLEIISRMSSNTKTYLTDDEEHARYVAMHMKAQADRDAAENG